MNDRDKKILDSVIERMRKHLKDESAMRVGVPILMFPDEIKPLLEFIDELGERNANIQCVK